MHPVNDERTELALREALELCDRHLKPDALPAGTAWRDEFEDLAEALRAGLGSRRLTVATLIRSPRKRGRSSCSAVTAAGDDVE